MPVSDDDEVFGFLKERSVIINNTLLTNTCMSSGVNETITEWIGGNENKNHLMAQGFKYLEQFANECTGLRGCSKFRVQALACRMKSKLKLEL